MVALYGAGVGGDTLSNTRLGQMSQSATKIQSVRFRAGQSSALNSIRMYRMAAVPDPGYSGGTTGTWVCEIYADDGTADHFPTGSALASQAFAASALDTPGFLITFASPATLVAGQLYHIVYTNTDADPENNFWSPNYWAYRVAQTGGPDGRYNPRFPIFDWSHLYYTHPAGPWVLRPGHVPIVGLIYANGATEGASYGAASLAAGQQAQVSGALLMCRERITVTGQDRLVGKVWIRCLKIAGGTDPLLIRLEDAGGGLIDQCSIDASRIATGLAPDGTDTATGNGSNAQWVSASFAARRRLVVGTTYSLRFSTGAGSTFWFWVNRRLSFGLGGNNYPAGSAFQDGVAEKTTDGSTYAAFGTVGDQHDLQFLLTDEGRSTFKRLAMVGA